MDTMILEVFSTDDLLAVERHLKDLSQIASIEETLYQVCNCSYLFFHRDLLPGFVNSLYERNLNSAVGGHMQLVLSAFSDGERILKHVRHLEDDSLTGTNPCFTSYQNFMLGVMKEGYVGRICEEIETDLRYVSWHDSQWNRLFACSLLGLAHDRTTHAKFTTAG